MKTNLKSKSQLFNVKIRATNQLPVAEQVWYGIITYLIT